MSGLIDIHRDPTSARFAPAVVALTSVEREAAARALGEYRVKVESSIRLHDAAGNHTEADRWRLELAAIQGAQAKIGPARAESVTP